MPPERSSRTTSSYKRPCHIRRRGLVERGAPALPAVARERELGDDEHRPANVADRQIQMTGCSGRILEDAKLANLGGDVVHVGWSIAAFHTDEHQQAAIDLPGRRSPS